VAYKAEKLKATYNFEYIFGEKNKINLLPEMLFRLLTVNAGLGAHWSI